ncbi:hypothetical protein K491DRAFT_654614 [Lophiostoma macrostomum CBS 122681]|uniref:Trafficking protein particle complex II-specific subunit 65 IgD3 domain-containing protein n=1 Tax=Lophiostoma macrostomum CBS 122681 TaxID=1314788 RepID=A0A6A6TD02_9PLEO|nr:hypothetical protein K491DRAFT_654614 [Lophiostoma macrostomum CBS 122681]
MAALLAERGPRASVEFVESSVLEAVVPANSTINLEDELATWDGSVDDESGPLLPAISQRQVLLFDEVLPVYVVFRTPNTEENTLKAYLMRLAINLEAFAFSTAPPPEPEAKAPTTKEMIFSETIKDANTPVIYRNENEESAFIYLMWKLEVFISRPKGRFHKPAIYFQPTASLRPAEKVKRSLIDDEYLPSKVPTALNLLQSFENDPALAGAHPRLSALRISKIAPTAPVAKELSRPIRTGQRRLFRALPALIWRMRYSKMHASLSDSSLMASLDLEIAHVTGCSMNVEDIELSLRAGSVDPIAGHAEAPMLHRPGDQITYLYKVRPDVTVDGTPIFGNEGHILVLKIKAKAEVSKTCRPNIFIEWRTPVNFTGDQDTSLIKAAYRLSNPTSQPAKAPHPDSLPSRDDQSQLGADAHPKVINITLTVSGPPYVQIGEQFSWNIFIVNRSDKTRKLALITIPKRRRDFDKHKSHPSASSVGGQHGEKKAVLASAVVDENIVYAKQKNARTDIADLVCLTTDVRIGHLAPGACYTAELKFLALSAGVLSVDAVRVMDLATQEVADLRDLPSIVAVDNVP